MLVDVDADTVDIVAAFMEPELSLEAVQRFLGALEQTVKDLIGHPIHPLELLLQQSGGNSYTSPSHAEQESMLNPIPALNENLERVIAEHVCELLRIQKSLVTPTTSLISIGLDSLRSVTLSRILKEDGIDLSAVDIVQADSIRKLLHSNSPAKRRLGASSESLQEIQFAQRILEDEIMGQDLKLSPGDSVLIMPATSLQAGMLSQVVAFCF